MTFLNDFTEYKAEGKCIAVLGKFDGVHKGHASLFEYARNCRGDRRIIAFTFAVREDTKVLTDSNERLELLEKCDVDVVIEQHMYPEFSAMSPYDFLSEVLIKRFNTELIVCGENFGFGRNRSGNVDFIKENADKLGYRVAVLPSLAYEGVNISSTVIRQKLSVGDIEAVNAMLGYRFKVSGTVVEGNRLGRKYNFPTANIYAPDAKLLPPNGVYATVVTINKRSYYGVTNVGVKPSVSDRKKVNIETYILGLDEDIYGENIQVEFCRFFRPERKFDGVDDLFKQIATDTQNIKEYFKENVLEGDGCATGA